MEKKDQQISEKEFSELLKKAQSGDIECQFQVSKAYWLGNGVEKNMNEAVKWATVAAEQGHMKSQHNLGVLYASGQGVNRDLETAKVWFQQAVEQECVPSMIALGRLFYNMIESSESDFEKAVHWFSLAANQGDPEAQFLLGKCQLDWFKQGGTANENVAIEWIIKAAKQGNGDAAYELAKNYYSGEHGVPKDGEHALKWYKVAIKQGNELAYLSSNVSFLWRESIQEQNKDADESEITERCKQTVFGLRQLALKSNIIEAMVDEGDWLIKLNPIKGFEWYTKAASKGNYQGQLKLANCYKDGLGVPQNYKEAIKWFELAAKQQSTDALSNLGQMYLDGLGVTRDLVNAYMWFNLAVSLSSREPYALDLTEIQQRIDTRDSVANELTAEQLEEGQRLSLEWYNEHIMKKVEARE